MAIAALLVVVAGCHKNSRASSGARISSLETSCIADADCTSVVEYYEDADGRCCRSCTPVAMNADYERQLAELCSAQGSEGCPIKKCKAPPAAVCHKGTCVPP